MLVITNDTSKQLHGIKSSQELDSIFWCGYRCAISIDSQVVDWTAAKKVPPTVSDVEELSWHCLDEGIVDDLEHNSDDGSKDWKHEEWFPAKVI